MEKRTVVITGGNSGLGYQCAKYIAINDKNYIVVIACRNPQKAKNAVENLRSETGNPSIYSLGLDLASLESIRKFYYDFCKEEYPPLYGLVCNAGLSSRNTEYTKDGFELTFGVNHLGHYLLSNLLLKQMAKNGRVVFVSSDTHDPSKYFPFPAPIFTNAERLAYPEKDGGGKNNNLMMRYTASKLCNILCTYELAARLAAETASNITSNAFNPGFMPDTNLVPSAANPVVRVAMAGLMKPFGGLGYSQKSGKALAALITDKQYERVTGKYYDRAEEVKSSEPSYDKAAAKKLWDESAELVSLSQSETLFTVNRLK